MELREIVKDDLRSCAELYSHTFSKEPWNERWSTGAALVRLEHFYDSKGFFGVLAKEDDVIGFVLGNIEPYHSGPIFYLREMCTDSTIQNRGIGSQLLSKLEETLQRNSVCNIYLLTEYGIPAAQFYQNRGYIVDENSGTFSKRIL